jgi:hypothetical protein
MTDIIPDHELWIEDKVRFGWEMPYAPWWKRLPVIRNIRGALMTSQVNKHNKFWASMGSIPSGYDRWVLYGVYRGWERKEK